MKHFSKIVLALGCASLLAPGAYAQSQEFKTKTKTTSVGNPCTA